MKLKCECRMHTLSVGQWRTSGAKWITLMIYENADGKIKRYELGDVLLDRVEAKKLLRYLQRWVKP